MRRSILTLFVLSLALGALQSATGPALAAGRVPVPSIQVQLSHPANRYLVTPIEGELPTLEGPPVPLPYGSSSGEWAQSGKFFSEQRGTPIGANIVYFSAYEDAFYRLKADFPVDVVKALARRAYANDESFASDRPMQPFIDIQEFPDYPRQFNRYERAYLPFTTVVLGFAPRGMVVVWFQFGFVSVQIGEYRAERIADDSAYARQLFSRISRTREQIRASMFLPDASPQPWQDYQTKYRWAPRFVLPGTTTRLYRAQIEYFNGEKEMLLRPWIDQPATFGRAIPKEITVFWKSSRGNVLQTTTTFDWKTVNDAFSSGVPGPGIMEMRLSEEDQNIGLRIDGRPFPAKSSEAGRRDGMRFKD